MEFARRWVRNVVGFDSRIYRGGAVVADFLSTARVEGVGTWRALRRLSDPAGRGKPPEPVRLRGLAHPILLRPGTDDAGTAINNVIRKEYGRFTPATAPRWMIDAGAYIGDVSAYFLSRFPELKVVALEPNEPSYELARRNMAPYGDRATVEKVGLFTEETIVRFGGDGLLAAISDKGTGTEIRCTTLPALMAKHAIARIDILKIDIEGAEEAIFRANPEAWLGAVGMLVMEIHGASVLSLVSDVLNRNGFSMRQYRSIWYCKREG